MTEQQNQKKKEAVTIPLGLAVPESMKQRFLDIKERYKTEGVNPRMVNKLVRDRLAQVFDELEKNLPA